MSQWQREGVRFLSVSFFEQLRSERMKKHYSTASAGWTMDRSSTFLCSFMHDELIHSTNMLPELFPCNLTSSLVWYYPDIQCPASCELSMNNSTTASTLVFCSAPACHQQTKCDAYCSHQIFHFLSLDTRIGSSWLLLVHSWYAPIHRTLWRHIAWNPSLWKSLRCSGFSSNRWLDLHFLFTSEWHKLSVPSMTYHDIEEWVYLPFCRRQPVPESVTKLRWLQECRDKMSVLILTRGNVGSRGSHVDSARTPPTAWRDINASEMETSEGGKAFEC